MTVHVGRTGSVLVVSIDRPEARNAVDRATAEALEAAFESFERDDDLRVLVLAGEGGTFSAGADLKAVDRGAGNRVERGGPGPLGPSRRQPSKPTIAAIDGHAVAGGLELALLCDLRVVEEDAIMGVFCRRWGVPLIDGGTVRLPRIIGLGRALDLILTGRAVVAAEALSIGLANRVVPKGTARAHAIELAEAIARFPFTCVREDRASTYEALDLAFVEAMSNELEHGLRSLAAPELAGKVAEFTAGRGRGGSFR